MCRWLGNIEYWQRVCLVCLFYSPCRPTQPCSEALSLRLFFLLAKIIQSYVKYRRAFFPLLNQKLWNSLKSLQFCFHLCLPGKSALQPAVHYSAHHFGCSADLFTFHMVLLRMDSVSTRHHETIINCQSVTLARHIWKIIR